jgi:hypothetical protein
MKKFADDIDTVFYFTYRFEIRSGTKRSRFCFQAEARAQIDVDVFRVSSGATRWRTLISDYFCNNGFWMNGDVACSRTSCQGLFVLKFGGTLGVPHSLHV